MNPYMSAVKSIKRNLVKPFVTFSEAILSYVLYAHNNYMYTHMNASAHTYMNAHAYTYILCIYSTYIMYADDE